MWGKTTQYEYDLAGRVVGTATIGNTVKFARAYEGISYNDGKGTIDSYYHKMIAANGDVLKTTNYTFTYGNASSGQIPDAVYTMVAGGKDFYFQYDGLGRLKKRTLNLNGDNDGVEEYTYKANGAKTSTVVASKRDFTGYLHTYTYNKNGNIKTETVGSNVREYTYDSLNRLKIYSDPVADVIEEYTYDNRGNIKTVETRKYGTPESDASTITYTYGNTTYKDRLTNYNGQALSYGTLGNPTKWANGKSMTWQYGRNLITVGDNITYAYNADGLRISKSGVRNTEYYIVGGKYIGEVTTIGSNDYKIAYVYDETDSVIGINVNGNPYYFAKNLQGDVLAILNYQGSVVARYTYDVWGKLIAVKNNDGAAITSNTHVAHLNPFRYRGYMYDKETGFYYLRSRYYDPEVGRFLNGDVLVSTGQGLAGYNMFAYCGNDPVNRIDTSGMFWEEVGAWFKKLGSKVEEYLTPSNIYSSTVGGTSISTSVLSTYVKSAIKSSPRPINIGVGAYAKQCEKELQSIYKFSKTSSKALTAVSYGAAAIDVGIGIYDNINNKAPFEKILTDATVDAVVTGGSIWAAGACGSAAGTAAGTVIPVAGNLIGAGVGFVVGIGIYALTDMVSFYGKSARSWAKEGLNSLW